MPDYKKTLLYTWLSKKDQRLASHISQVRDEVSKWLPYLLQIYPHYPQHGVEHSDRIIAQLSAMLFVGKRPVVEFSAAEVYCLLCATYLHDIGMVVPQSEVSDILTSEAWKSFTADGGQGHEAYIKYETARKGPIENEIDRSHFLADVALRRLIAEFIRKTHHERSRTVLEMNPSLRQLVDQGDPVAFETIASVSVGHGFGESELADESLFPEERDVLNGKVNVHFLTRLLRIGDLLDMDTKRADPISAIAAAPLPLEAIPHWKQYSCKIHENISPKIIEFTFACEDQETHRTLRDWFGWLESEIRTTGIEQMHAERHKKWEAPRCVVSSRTASDSGDPKAKPTIIIKPAKDSTYTFHDWKLELDQEKVLQRLIYDVYDNPSIFVRELIQNALDATRCRMYKDFGEQHPGIIPPAYPTGFEATFREKYPVQVSLVEEQSDSATTAGSQKRWVFIIEDFGIGMSEHTITHYFLQVGRSYYQSGEFRERFKFVPTSRFGVGFLSVFAVSNDITVETAQRDDSTGVLNGIRLCLRGPKSYMLTEKWAPFPERNKNDQHGTRIRIVLDSSYRQEKLLDLIRNFCVRVEVPIYVCEKNQKTVVSYAPLKDGEVLAQSKSEAKGYFAQRVFQINAKGIEGQLLICTYVDATGREGWCDCWSQELGLDGGRLDNLPPLPKDFVALHGIVAGSGVTGRGIYRDANPWRAMVDVRSAEVTLPMSRTMSHSMSFATLRSGEDYPNIYTIALSAIQTVAESVVAKHLSTTKHTDGEFGCYYVGRVLSAAPVSDLWRKRYPNCIVTWQRGQRVNCSAEDILSLQTIVLSYWNSGYRILRKYPLPAIRKHPSSVLSSFPIVSFGDTPTFIDDELISRIKSMTLNSVTIDDDLWLFKFGMDRSNANVERAYADANWWIVDSENMNYSTVLPNDGNAWHLLNRKHWLVDWLIRLRAAARETTSRVDPAAVRAAWKCVAEEPWNHDDLIQRWTQDPQVPRDLKPPVYDKNILVTINYMHLTARRTIGVKIKT